MKLPRKLKKALKKAITDKYSDWRSDEVEILSAGPVAHIHPARRSRFIQTKGKAILSHKMIAK